LGLVMIKDVCYALLWWWEIATWRVLSARPFKSRRGRGWYLGPLNSVPRFGWPPHFYMWKKVLKQQFLCSWLLLISGGSLINAIVECIVELLGNSRFLISWPNQGSLSFLSIDKVISLILLCLIDGFNVSRMSDLKEFRGLQV
jgi:hypothetical protein